MRTALLSVCLVFSMLPAAQAADRHLPGDAPGAADHPAVTRYPGAVIKWTQIDNHRPYRIATGPITGYRKIDTWVETEGRLTRIYYEIDAERTHTEVYANYKKALEDAGMEILVAGAGPKRTDIGGRAWLGIQYGENPIEERSAGILLLQGSATSGGGAFVAARKERADGNLFVAVGITQYSDKKVTVLVDVMEEAAVEADLIVVDADAMGEDIDEYGKVALYGLFFDHDKATLKAESKAALDEIAKFLKARPTLNVYVVGHTDSTGAFGYNHKLSEDRARSVADALVKTYGIDSKRLEPHGVGPLSPVFANHTDPGRAKNRRVELVER
ncbi:MAG: OmpA family protein [Myxococcales bacterium]|nr:OmpA family protein [Myxococcales bacterium]